MRLPLSVSVFSGGNKIVPVEITPTRLENRVVVVVNTESVETLVTAEETTVATVGNEVVSKASVIVVTGKGEVFAETENTETLPATTEPLSVLALNGLEPPRMLIGPDSASRAVGLSTWVHWIRALLLLSILPRGGTSGMEQGRYPTGRFWEKVRLPVDTVTSVG